MTIDRNRYDADLDIPEHLPGATETYIRPLADLHEATAREPRDVILLLAIRETFALYGAAGSTDDERDYLTEDVARILALDPDSKVDPTQIRGFFIRTSMSTTRTAVRPSRWSGRGACSCARTGSSTSGC